MSKVRLLYGSTIPGHQFLSPDLYWKTRFNAYDPFFLVEFPDGDTVMLASMLEFERAKKEAKNCRAELVTQYMDDGRTTSLDAVAALLQRFCPAPEGIVVPASMPAYVFNGLLDAGFSVEVAEYDAPWYPGRAIKSEEEIAWIEEVQRKTEAVLWKVVRILRDSKILPGDGILVDEHGSVLTAERVRDFMELELSREGCLADSTVVACGDQAVDPHAIGSGPLRANLPIVIDVYPRSRSTWYWADMTRTFFKGKPTAEAERLYWTVLSAQCLAIQLIYAGIDGSKIQRAVEGFFKTNGYETGEKDGVIQGFTHSVGHGVGLELHEHGVPNISTTPSELKEGCVVTVEPGLYYLGIGGARIEDLVVVTKDGCRNLTSFPKDLEHMIIP